MDLRDADVQLSTQRLRELMLWHGKDEGNLPPAATLANLSRDTIAALSQLQLLRTQLSELRAALSLLFWACDSSTIRRSLLAALGPPPQGESSQHALPVVSWEASPHGVPQSALANELQRERSAPQRVMG